MSSCSLLSLVLGESYLASLGNSRSNSRPQTEDSFPFTPKVADSDRAAPEASPAPKQKAEEEEEKKQEDNRVEKSSRKKVPIVFHWDHGGNHVCVCGTFNNWEKTQMNKRCVHVIELSFRTHSVDKATMMKMYYYSCL